MKRLSRRQRKLFKKPWISKGILVSIRKKRILFKNTYLNGNSTQKAFFKKYSNKLTKIKSFAKKLYFKKQLSENSGDPKKTWQILKTLIPQTGKSAKRRQKHNQTNEFDGLAETNKFNDFFLLHRQKFGTESSLSRTRQIFVLFKTSHFWNSLP